MSLNSEYKLRILAKNLSRELRKNTTPEERIFWELVRNRRFNNSKFYRQYPLFFDYLGKETFYIADFCCFEKKMIIEIDGEYHKQRIEEDSIRDEVLNYSGYKVIRFTNHEIMNDIENVKKRLELELQN